MIIQVGVHPFQKVRKDSIITPINSSLNKILPLSHKYATWLGERFKYTQQMSSAYVENSKWGCCEDAENGSHVITGDQMATRLLQSSLTCQLYRRGPISSNCSFPPPRSVLQMQIFQQNNSTESQIMQFLTNPPPPQP